jgi:hypothetical protein
MYNCISVVIFHFSWKMQSDVWGTVQQMVLFHILLVVTLHKVQSQLMDGYVISYGHKLLK